MSRTWGILLRSGVALAVFLLAFACGGGGGYSSPTEPRGGPKTVTVAVKDFEFDPRQVTINPGDTVRWVMQGKDQHHSVTALNGAFDSGLVFTSGGAAFEHTFSEANQTFEYYCRAHRACCNMTGSILVGDAAPPPQPGY